MASVSVSGAQLDVVERGQGTPLLFVHGSASDRRSWQGQLDAFGARYRAIAYSRRWHWPNAPIGPGEDYAMLRHVDDLREVILGLDAAPAHLVGHSYGAFLCLLLALREPALVRSLVLAEPPAITLFASSPPRPPELLRLLVTRPRAAAALLKFGLGGVAPAVKAFRRGDDQHAVRLFGRAVFGPGGYDRMNPERRGQIQDNLSNVKAELTGSGFAALDCEQLRRLRLPVLLLEGERSIPLFGQVMDRLAELLPSARRVRLAGATHMLHGDNPDDFRAAVLDFLAGTGAS